VAAARALGHLGKDAVGLLTKALADAALDVREAAVIGLGAAWGGLPVSELAARLADEKSADVRFAAALALARRIDSQRGIGFDAMKGLEDVIAQGQPIAKLPALMAKAFAGRPDAMASLLHVLREGD
jgi:hypothetical protein